MRISVITPIWNRVDLTQAFLSNHWIRYGTRGDIEWIIIDNGSTDSTGQLLTTMSSPFKKRLNIITNSENLGFSKACNQGAELAKGDLLVFVNNDVIISGDYLSVIETELAKNPRVLAGAVMFDFDTGWNKFGNKLISYLPGWCLAMRADTFKVLGGFDERYTPCDFEDMDLCYTAKAAGYELVSLRLPIHHMDSQTARSHLPQRREITERNRIKFKEKWGL